jgi:histidinol phosphatase-like enzyme
MIGDAWSDVQAGEAAGMRGTILLKTGRGTEQLLKAPPENMSRNLIFDDLLLALQAILSIDNVPEIGPQS